MCKYSTAKGNCYTHFSREEREEIAIGLERGESIRSIAKKLSRNPSSVSREIRRNTLLFRLARYRGNRAHQRAAERSMRRALEQALRRVPPRLCRTLVFENASHEALGTKSYFCKPYHSWEKGSIENRNGILRRYYPKKHVFSTPMKCFRTKVRGYRTLADEHQGVNFRLDKPPARRFNNNRRTSEERGGRLGPGSPC